MDKVQFAAQRLSAVEIPADFALEVDTSALSRQATSCAGPTCYVFIFNFELCLLSRFKRAISCSKLAILPEPP